MPFKSKAQMRKFFAMYNRGEISKKTLDKWLKHTPDKKNLPERVQKKSVVQKNEIIEIDDEIVGLNPKKIAYACIHKMSDNLGIKDPEELLTLIRGFNAALAKEQNKSFDQVDLVKAAFLIRRKLMENGKYFQIKEAAEQIQKNYMTKKANPTWLTALAQKFGLAGGVAAAGLTGAGTVLGIMASLAILGSAVLPYLGGTIVGRALADVKNKELEKDIETAGTTSLIAHLEEKMQALKRDRKMKEKIMKYQQEHPDEEIIIL